MVVSRQVRHFPTGIRQSSDSGRLERTALVEGEAVEDQLAVLLDRKSMLALAVEREAWRGRIGTDFATDEVSEWPYWSCMTLRFVVVRDA